jgi:TonB family protein
MTALLKYGATFLRILLLVWLSISYHWRLRLSSDSTAGIYKMKLLILMLLFALVSATVLPGQSTEMTHFEKDGIAFDFPLDWKMVDESESGTKHFVVSEKGGKERIAIILQSIEVTDGCNLEAARQKLNDTLIETIAKEIQAVRPLQLTTVSTQVTDQMTQGVQIHGSLKNYRVTSETYVWRHRLSVAGLIHIWLDEDAANQHAWSTVRSSLTLSGATTTVTGTRSKAPLVTMADKPRETSGPVVTTTIASPSDAPEQIKGGVLNGKALRLVQPPYPSTARKAHASGTVAVQIVIDENGEVTSAHAISGHPLLQAAAVLAAKSSKFSPTTLCGEPVKVTGIVQYNFVAQ